MWRTGFVFEKCVSCMGDKFAQWSHSTDDNTFRREHQGPKQSAGLHYHALYKCSRDTQKKLPAARFVSPPDPEDADCKWGNARLSITTSWQCLGAIKQNATIVCGLQIGRTICERVFSSSSFYLNWMKRQFKPWIYKVHGLLTANYIIKLGVLFMSYLLCVGKYIQKNYFFTFFE